MESKQALEKVDVGDKDLEVVKVFLDDLFDYKDEDNKDNLHLKNLFDEANENEKGVEYFYRKVLGDGLDKPNVDQLIPVPPEEPLEKVYEKVMKKDGEFKKPGEGIQFVKVVGHVKPEDITDHMVNKDKPEDNPNVQFVKTKGPDENGNEIPIQYFKAANDGKKPGEDPVYYKLKGDIKVKDIVEQIQNDGKPEGNEGVHYEKVKGNEIPEVEKLFKDKEDIPRVLYHTTYLKMV